MSNASLSQLLTSHRSYLLGHRGARGEIFENSLAGFIHTQQLSKQSKGKLVGIEFDVQLTQDGRLMVFHDESLLRLYHHQSRVDQCSIHQLQKLSLKLLKNGTYPLMVLEDMPQYLTGYSHIELEIKTHKRSNYQQLIQALKNALSQSSFKNLPITLTTFDLTLHHYIQSDGMLRKYKRGLLLEPMAIQVNKSPINDSDMAPQLSNNPLKSNNSTNPMVSTGQPLSKTAEIAKRLGCVSVGLYYPLYNSDIMEQFKKHNLSTSAWTVNNIEEARRLITLGVKYIITDHPTKFLKD